MNVGVILPAAEVDGQGNTPGWSAILAFALHAEGMGLDSVWMFDDFFDRSDTGVVVGMHEAWTS